MRIPFLITLSLLSWSPAWALNPPTGWTSTGDHSAIYDPRNPDHAEIREFVSSGAKGDPDELRFILLGAGLSPSQIEVQATGAVHLEFDDRLARARFRPDPVTPSWLVLFMSKDTRVKLDPDAVLVSMLPIPTGVGNGAGAVTPLDSGQDGDPWGAEVEEGKSESGWISDIAQLETWSQDAALVGRWEGSAFKLGQPLYLALRLEADGVMVLPAPRVVDLELL